MGRPVNLNDSKVTPWTTGDNKPFPYSSWDKKTYLSPYPPMILSIRLYVNELIIGG